MYGEWRNDLRKVIAREWRIDLRNMVKRGEVVSMDERPPVDAR